MSGLTGDSTIKPFRNPRSILLKIDWNVALDTRKACLNLSSEYVIGTVSHFRVFFLGKVSKKMILCFVRLRTFQESYLLFRNFTLIAVACLNLSSEYVIGTVSHFRVFFLGKVSKKMILCFVRLRTFQESYLLFRNFTLIAVSFLVM